MSTPPESTTRRVPPPCWTQEETLILIEAYRDKWFSVNRGHLRSADWDAVATAVNESASADPPKSSLQCRHKIEKLRKRYRTEKQRCLNYPGRFLSSWNLFPLLDSMAIGSAGNKQCQGIEESNDIGDGFRVKTLGDRYLVTPNNLSHMDRDFEPDFDLGLDPDLALRARKVSRIEAVSDSNISHASENGFYLKPVSDLNAVSVAFRPRYCGGRVVNGYETGVPMKMEKTEMGSSFLPQGPKLKSYRKISGDSDVGEGGDAYVGFPVKTLGDVPRGFRPKNYRKIDRKASPNFVNDLNYRSETINDKRDRLVAENVVGGWISPPPVFKANNYCKIDGSSKLDVDSKILNGFGDVKKSDIQGTGRKEALDPIAELVSAIKMCTTSFVKVEKMKMEMAMEIEKLKMDMLLKHNQMILESQKQIVDAFVTTLLEKKKKQREEVEELSPYEDKNGDNSQVAALDCESIGKSAVVKEGCQDVVLT
ncbi:hypothetical protein JCGZ_03496 [Jatropha curcas]|uniref:Myb-like domain-containing protein n=1 Tax=Jatropha curcas TaxID=180498 RepID=A0A067L637_JATCU|nr:trihelix transcription factor ASIL2 [Jatropha curcas]KDP39965.1 hypothetical protein JCGZ_03496 [Jatropha curcas]